MKTLVKTLVIVTMGFGLITLLLETEPEETAVRSADQTILSRPSRGLIAAWPLEDESVQTSAVEAVHPTTGNYLVIFDGSGSMKGAKLRDAKDAVAILSETVPESDHLGLIAFTDEGLFGSDSVELLTPLGRGAANRVAFKEALERIEAGGGTPLGEALELGVTTLSRMAQTQRTLGAHYTLLIVTDGEASDGGRLQRVLAQMLPADAPPRSPIVFQTVGFGIDERHVLNQPGRTLYTSARDGAALREALRRVAVEEQNFAADTQFQ